MSGRGFLVIDGSNVGYAATATKVLKVGDQETQGIFGFMRIIRPYLMRMPQLVPIILWDGTTFRKGVFEDYKANRDKEATTKHELEQVRIRKSFAQQRPLIKKMLTMLGVRQMICLNLEADDLAGIMVRQYAADRKVILLSGDKDWVQLIGPNVAWLDPIGKTAEGKPRRCTIATLKDVFGVETPRQFLEFKALTGDMSDNITGVGGIGDKGAVEFLETYGSVGAFMNGVHLEKTIDLKALPKKYRDFAESDEKQNLFRRNMMLMDLHSPQIPKPLDLTITKGNLDQDAFAAFCREMVFKSILDDVPGFVEPFERVA